MDILLILAGLALLFAGGEFILKGSVSIAHRLHISTFLVGVVIVGFGTSLPELTVSVAAGLRGETEIAIGNIVGSNIANILFILGLCCVFVPIACPRPEIKRDAIAVLVSSLLVVLLALYGAITRPAGLCMLFLLIAYVSYCYYQERKKHIQAPYTQPQSTETIKTTETIESTENTIKPPLSTKVATCFCIAGLAFLITGAYCLLEGAVSLARTIGIPDAVIGLTLVAVGTSLPELITSIVAVYRKHSDIILGNILGSNLFNVLGILGITSLLSPLHFSGRIADTDVWVMLAVSCLLLIALTTGKRLNRLEGGGFFIIYVGYIFWMYSTT